MNQSKIDHLIVKLIENTINDDESVVLKDWLKKDSNKIYFKEWIEINYLMNSKNKFDYKDSLEKFNMITKKQSRNKFTNYLKYAAAVLIFMSAGYYATKEMFWNENKTELAIKELTQSTIKTGSKKAVLTLADGSIVILEKGNNYSNKSATSDGEKITYNKISKDSKNDIAFNYLTIPRGGEFYIQLSDGTQVWLNSESQLKFPIAFEERKIRQVELVYGEGYFDVSPSAKHKGSKFKVLNKFQDIEVVGTEFNIKAYKDDENVLTTLIEGKVNVTIANKIQVLQPNQQLNLNLKTNISIINTVDVHDDIAWKEGVFSFERKPLKEIMKVLSRWYDVDVVFKNKSLEEVKFFGVLGKNQSITEILETIKKYKIIKSYEIKGKTVLIK